jgi:Glycosyl hydrolases family 38 N-terminal domain
MVVEKQSGSCIAYSAYAQLNSLWAYTCQVRCNNLNVSWFRYHVFGNSLHFSVSGWIKTFEQYYEQQTRNILNLMVEKLEQYPQMRFIFAEISYFSLWWSNIDADMRKRVQKYVLINIF